MLRIVTDGAADLAPGWDKEYGINVIPINVHFGEKTFLQNEELDNEGFYRLVGLVGNLWVRRLCSEIK